MLLRPGDVLEGRLDTYTVDSTITRGGYGYVYLARALDGSWRVIKQSLPTEELSAAELVLLRNAFEREAELLTIVAHPLVVRGFELVGAGDDRFLVMEHVQGETLRALFDRHLLSSGTPWPAPRVASLGAQIARFLGWLHGLPGRPIYRDLKPANMMWDGVAQTVRLIDFGLIWPTAVDRPADQRMGTSGYAAPELYGSTRLTPAADLYSLGAVLYEFMTGQPPPDREPPRDFAAAPDAPAELKRLIQRCTQPNPANRPAHAAEVLAALERLVPASLAPLTLTPRNCHPPLACLCPVCGRGARTAGAAYCGFDGALYNATMLAISPRYRPPRTLYLDRDSASLGRRDPDQNWYPDLDLTEYDPLRHLSRREAVLRRVGQEVEVQRVGQTNAWRLNGQVLTAEAPVRLSAGDRLELGDLCLTLLRRPVIDPSWAPAAEPADA